MERRDIEIGNDHLAKSMERVSEIMNMRLDDVSAEFKPFDEFRIDVERSEGRTRILVSDYLCNAPFKVLKGVLLFAVNTFVKHSSNAYLSLDVVSYFKGRITQSMHLNEFLIRHPSMTVKGRDLYEDTFDDMLDEGILQESERPVFVVDDSLVEPYKVYPVINVIAFSREVTDYDTMPDSVLDYLMYEAMCHLRIGYDPEGKLHASNFEAMLDGYSAENETAWLDIHKINRFHRKTKE